MENSPTHICAEAVVPYCFYQLLLENFSGFRSASLEHNASSAERVLPTLGAKIGNKFQKSKKRGKKNFVTRVRNIYGITQNEPSPPTPLTPTSGVGSAGGEGCISVSLYIRARGYVFTTRLYFFTRGREIFLRGRDRFAVRFTFLQPCGHSEYRRPS
jgi:hypothetical protein